MPEHAQLKGWPCCVMCMVKPWQLARLSFNVSVTTAGLWGGLAMMWYINTITLYAAMLRPNTGQGHTRIFDDIPDALSTGFVVSIPIACLYIVLFLFPAMSMTRNKQQAVVFANSLLCPLIPYSIWISLVALSLDPINYIKPKDLANVGVMIPVLLIAWFVTLIINLRQASRIAALKHNSFCDCGYDLRGNLAAGSDNCPECGRTIPKAKLINAPSIHTEV